MTDITGAQDSEFGPKEGATTLAEAEVQVLLWGYALLPGGGKWAPLPVGPTFFQASIRELLADIDNTIRLSLKVPSGLR